MILLVFASAAPASQNIEDISISIAKAVGIITAVAIGSWTTARKLQSIEDSISDSKRDRKILFNELKSVKYLIQQIGCVRAETCERWKAPRKKKR